MKGEECCLVDACVCSGVRYCEYVLLVLSREMDLSKLPSLVRRSCWKGVLEPF